MNCIIVDDEAAAIELLEGYLSRIPDLSHCGSFLSPVEALRYAQSHSVDLIFLDINMPHLSGIGFLDLLGGDARVVLTSAYSEYALEGYKYDVLDYLTKPISFEDFLRAVRKAEERGGIEGRSKTRFHHDFIMVKSDRKGKLVKVALSDIVYIESMRNYVAIYTRNMDRIITLISMRELEQRLPKQHFLRTHKTFIVAINQIKMIDGGEIILREVKDKVPLGGTYRQSFFENLEPRIM